MKALIVTDNLLINPSFEVDSNADGLADGWIDEHTSVTGYHYFLVTSGVVDGLHAQNVQYTGESTDTGSQKVEIYQYTNFGAFQAGDTAEFSLWVSGSMTNAYAVIVIEAHDSNNAWLGEIEKVITPTLTPQLFSLSYQLPINTSRVVVLLQNPELTPTASINLTLDQASLRRYQSISVT